MKTGKRMMICLAGLALMQAPFIRAEEIKGPAADPLDPPTYAVRTAQASGRSTPLTTGTEFNPAISLIVDLTYTHTTDELEGPAGFEWGGHGHEDGEGHDHGHDHGLKDGFQLRAVELTLSGTVDPYFDAQATLHFTEDEVEVEEAYFTTRMLPAGLQLKGGKFLSDVGYINKQHAHDWTFIDQPWLREYFFGDEGLNEVGLQVSWLPPTETYIRLGAEVLQGESEGIASYIGEDGFKEEEGPRLFTAFTKWAPDIGVNQAIQFGAFGGFSRAFQKGIEHDGHMDRWEGDGWFAGLDMIYKHDGQGVMGHRNFVVQAEYIYRQLDLAFHGGHEAEHDHVDHDHGESAHEEEHEDQGHQDWKQDGLYVQAAYGFAPRWNAGLRWDALGLINEGYDHDEQEDFGTSYRYTAQLTFAPTEFTRIRAQASYMDLARAEHGHDDHDTHDGWRFALQFMMSLGAHGAHAF